jgi:hypothetical protein
MKTLHNFGAWASANGDEAIFFDCERWGFTPYMAVNGAEHSACMSLDKGIDKDAYNLPHEEEFQ